MNSIKNYVRSCFNMGIDVDAKQYSQNGKLQLLEQREYLIYVTPIPFLHLKKLQKECIYHIEKATQIWSQILNNGTTFKITDTTYMADIKVYWGKETTQKSGVCFTERGLGRNNQYVTIGLMDINGKEYQTKDIYTIILHEFGHIIGLGHSEDEKDIMYKQWNNVSEPSLNDISVLKLIYSLRGLSYNKCKHLIDSYLNKNTNNKTIKIDTKKDIFIELEDLGNINRYNLILQWFDCIKI